MHPFPYARVLALLIVSLSTLGKPADLNAAPTSPDSSLLIERVADSDQIKHPIGIAFDRKGRLLAIESHTHFPPANYKGPKHDRVLLFELTEEGRVARRSIFFEGIQRAMDIACHPDGSIYLATRNEILKLNDRNGDGKINRATEATRLVFCETKGNYPHNGLAGLAFDKDGHLFFGMGENLGVDYTLVGSDNGKHQGGGEGGNVFWCRADGSKLRRVATGFWNPFGAVLNEHQQLFVVDNDPDSTPYCRLLHVIEGGNYGYQFRYGRSGLHPFQSWHGDQPGTLPLVSPTGEAPCELIKYSFTKAGGLPHAYRGLLMSASWADHRIECFKLKPKGASFEADRSVLIQGGDDFRPVGMAVAPDGSLYVSDWVKRDYKLHGHGRIWRISSKQPQKIKPGGGKIDRPTDQQNRLQKLADTSVDWPIKKLLDATIDDDPFVRTAAIHRLTTRLDEMPADWGAMTPQPGPTLDHIHRQRQIARLLTFRTGATKPEQTQLLETLFKHRAAINSDAVFLGLKWIADDRLGSFEPQVMKVLETPSLSSKLYTAAITAIARIQELPAGDRKLHTLVKKQLTHPRSSAGLKLTMLRMLDQKSNRLSLDDIRALLQVEHPPLRRELLQVLAEHRDDRSQRILKRWATSEADSNTRAWAWLGLADARDLDVDALITAATDRTDQASDGTETRRIDAIQEVALQALTGASLNKDQKQKLVAATWNDPALTAMRDRAIGRPFFRARPDDTDTTAWQQRLASLPGKANTERGRRVFFHPKLAGCFRCHQVQGHGQAVGPDLSGKSATLAGSDSVGEPLLKAILQPSALIQPRYHAWQIQLKDGSTKMGFYVRQNRQNQIYVDTTGKRFEVNRDGIAKRESVRFSIMPKGLVNVLTDHEIRDLLAFLKSPK